MESNKLAATFRRDFPHHVAVDTFDAHIPVYTIQLMIEVLEKRKLNPFQTYILQFMGLGIQTLEQFANFLGVDEEALLSSVVGLLDLKYIEESVFFTEEPQRRFVLTDLGRLALDQDGPPPVPTRIVGRFFWNALTWTPFQSEEKILYPDEAAKLGLITLPSREAEKPTLGTFTEGDVRRVLKDAPGFQQKTIVTLLKLKEVVPRYIGPVTVVVLQHQGTREKTVAIYQNGVQQGSETEVLQRLYEAKTFHLPASVSSHQNEQIIPLPSTLSPGVAQEIQQLVYQEREREEIEIQVETKKIQKSATQDARERATLETNLQQLQAALRQKSQEIHRLNQHLRQSKVEFLRTEQHHARLLQALREAKEEVIIISPWLNRDACDNEVCQLIGAAISRGVRVRIGYGMGHERNREVVSRNHHNIEEVKKAIKNAITNPSFSAYLDDIVETAGTHQKILVCDRRFAIAGSFNWLSYRGKRDGAFRLELSAVFRQLEVVDELATIALRAWQTRSPASLTSLSPRKKTGAR